MTATAPDRPQGGQPRRQLGWHLLALLLIATVRLAANHNVLLTGVDGSYATFSQYPGVLFTDPRSVLSISPYFGFGAPFPGPSPFTDPFGLVLVATGSVVTAYVLFAVIIFLAIYALARGLGTTAGAALAAGWIMVLAVLPFWHGGVLMIEIAGMIHPSSTFVIVLFCAVSALFLQVGRHGLGRDAGLAAGFLVMIVASWINNLSFMALALPFTAVALPIFMVTSLSWREAAWKAGCLTLAAGLFVWLGIGSFLDSYSAYNGRLVSMIGHPQALPAPQRWYLLSLVNEFAFAKFPQFFLAGAPLLGWIGLAGLIQGILLGNRRWRLLCLATLGGTVGLTLMSSEYAMPGIIWPWAAPNYMERACYPVYVIAAVLLVQQLAIFARSRGAGLIDRAPPWLRQRVRHPEHFQKQGLALVVIAAVVASLIQSGPATLLQKMVAPPLTFPPPDSPWRRFARLVPVEKNQPFSGWFTDQTASGFGYHVQVWRSGGGTLFAIPAEDNLQGAALRRLELLTPVNRQLALLGAYGLAYVYNPALPADDVVAPAGDMPGLLRLRAANLGDFTPTEVTTVTDFDAFEGLVAAGPIDWRRTVVLDPAAAVQVGRDLIAPRQLSPPLVVTNGLRLAAATDGRSLLLLPRQFSHCYIWRPDPGSSERVTVLRANMLQTALLFQGRIAGKLDYVYRWGDDGRCRAQDAAAARALAIGPHPISEGRYGPIGQYIMLPAQIRARQRAEAAASRPRDR